MFYRGEVSIVGCAWSDISWGVPAGWMRILESGGLPGLMLEHPFADVGTSEWWHSNLWLFAMGCQAGVYSWKIGILTAEKTA